MAEQAAQNSSSRSVKQGASSIGRFLMMLLIWYILLVPGCNITSDLIQSEKVSASVFNPLSTIENVVHNFNLISTKFSAAGKKSDGKESSKTKQGESENKEGDKKDAEQESNEQGAKGKDESEGFDFLKWGGIGLAALVLLGFYLWRRSNTKYELKSLLSEALVSEYHLERWSRSESKIDKHDLRFSKFDKIDDVEQVKERIKGKNLEDYLTSCGLNTEAYALEIVEFNKWKSETWPSEKKALEEAMRMKKNIRVGKIRTRIIAIQSAMSVGSSIRQILEEYRALEGEVRKITKVE